MGPLQVLNLGDLVMAQDCTGATFGLWQAKTHIGAQLVGEPNTLVWCEVNTRNRQQTADFYQTVCQLEPHGLERAEGSTLNLKEKAVCGIMPIAKEWGETAPHWMVHFASEDTDAAAERVQAAGGRVCYPAFDTPRGRLAIVEDPMGAAFSIIQPHARAV